MMGRSACRFALIILTFLPLSTTIVARSFGQESQEPKLYVFCEADERATTSNNTGKINIGRYLKEVSDRIKDELRKMAFPGRLVVYNDSNSNWTGPVLSESDSVGDDILSAVRQCPATENDSIFFFWTGHGGFDDDGHYLIVPKKGTKGVTLRRQTLIKALEEKNARLTVLFTDCCYKYYKTNEGGDHTLGLVSPRSPLFDSLFFKPKGFIDLYSSLPGQPSYVRVNLIQGSSNSGGWCSHAFAKALHDWSDYELGWNDVFEKINARLQKDTEVQNTSGALGGFNSSLGPKLPLYSQQLFCLSSMSGEGESWVVRNGRFSEPTHRPNPGDRIVAVNGYRINSVEDFRVYLKYADASRGKSYAVERLVMTVVDGKDGSKYYLCADVGEQMVLGYTCNEGNEQGVVVNKVEEGKAGAKCRLLK